jgi:ADP-heptose:LPS heptosyltransferase
MIRRPGVIRPSRRGGVPNRVINIQSKKGNNTNEKIRIDKLNQIERPKVCVRRRLGGIGDVLMTTPLLTSLKALLPKCHLIYCTDPEYSDGALFDIIKHNPYVDQLISNEEYDDYKYNYTVDLTLTGLHREKPGTIPPNRIDMFAEEVGVSINSNPVPVYNVTEEERKVAKKTIEDKYLLGAKREDVKIILIQARSNDARRTWPLNKVDTLCKTLAQDPNKRIILMDWGSSCSKWKEEGRLFLLLNEKLVQVAALMEQADLVVCPDSSSLHLAGALNKKIVTIFGPIPPESRVNYYSNTSVVDLNLSCRCWYVPRCANTEVSKLACLTTITPEMVVDAIEKRLKKPLNTKPITVHGSEISRIGGQDPIILVKRMTPGIGDLVMATTGIEALKKRYPNKEIHVAVQPYLRDVLKHNPYIDEVLDVRQAINMRRYHVTIDISTPCARYEVARIRGNKLVEKNRVEVFAEALGTREVIDDIRPRFYLSDEEKENVFKFLVKDGLDKNKSTIGIVGDSAELYRDWPKNHYIKLAKQLRQNYNVIILNKVPQETYQGIINVTGHPFRAAAAALSYCDLLITVDTGFLHIAEALNIKSIALFGPIDYRARCKGYKHTTVMTSNLPCIPCWRNNHIKCKENNAVKCYSRCMETIQPKHVLKVIKSKIKG